MDNSNNSNEEEETIETRIRKQSFVGTANYLSPEGLQQKYSPKNDIWALGGLPSGFLAILRLNIADLGTSTKKILNPTNFKVNPNPATESFNVDINLEQFSQNVTITILDINGKTLKQQHLNINLGH